MAMSPTPPDLFGADEMFKIVSLPKTAMDHLSKAGLLPAHVAGGGGRGARRLYDLDGVIGFVVIDAFFRAGLNPIPAARLARAVIEAFGWRRFLPVGLDDLSREARSAGASYAALTSDSLFERMGAIIDALGESAVIRTLKNEWVLEIVDRRFIFDGNLLEEAGFPSFKPNPCAEIIGWEHGSDAFAVKQIYEFDATADGGLDLDAFDADASAARANASSCLRLFIGKSIRMSFAALHRQRKN